MEGAGQNGGAIIFENETMLEFSRQFLSISISTNKAIYDGTQVSAQPMTRNMMDMYSELRWENIHSPHAEIS